ncbi:MAG TPA: cupin-like domain-containing protein [Blastocatellia bacterium]|nr:cupin-like domain-containing protein [Blastocatellia bacterium]
MSAQGILDSTDAKLYQQGREGRPSLLDLDRESFLSKFNREPFTIGHRLADNPLFALPRLIELARRLPAEHVSYNSGDVPVTTGLYKGPQTGLSIEETIRQIEQCRSWMVLKFVEDDPEYRRLLDGCLDEVKPLSERVAPGMRQRQGFIFISSASSVTPYHMDPEYNFLLQVRGRKKVTIWNPADRSILSERELEDYYSGCGFQITFKEEYLRKAATFELTPGRGLHFPVTAPHFVENRDEVSISFSITFQTPASERRRLLYGANARLRGLGIKPSPVGQSLLRDSTKRAAFSAYRVAKHLLTGARSRPAQRY